MDKEKKIIAPMNGDNRYYSNEMPPSKKRKLSGIVVLQEGNTTKTEAFETRQRTRGGNRKDGKYGEEKQKEENGAREGEGRRRKDIKKKKKKQLVKA